MRSLITGAPPSPLAVFDVGDDQIQAILNEVFTSRFEHRLVRLDQLRERLIRSRPRLVGLPPLEYGKPDGDEDDDDDEVLTTAVFNFDEAERSEHLREAQRRIVGASALPQGMNSPRSVRPPPRPMAPPSSAFDEPEIEIMEEALPRLPGSIGDAFLQGAEPQSRQPSSSPAPLPPRKAVSDSAIPPSLPHPTPPVANPSALAAPRAAAHPISHPPASGSPASVPPTSGSPASVPPASGSPASVPPGVPSWIPTRPVHNEVNIGDHTSSQAHIASIGPPGESGRPNPVTYVLGLLCLLAGAGAAYITLGDAKVLKPSAPPNTLPAPSTAAPKAPEPKPEPSLSPSGSPSTVASPAPTKTPGPAPDAASKDDVSTCVMSLFPTETFEGSTPNFSKMCSTSNPIRGSRELHGEVVRAGGGSKGVTTGMGEMSTMGWYRLAAFSIIRGHCCTDPTPFKTPTMLECNLDHTLERLAREVNRGGDLASEAAVKQVTKSFYCLARGGAAEFFGQAGMPNGGELTTFLRLLVRVRKKAVRKFPQ